MARAVIAGFAIATLVVIWVVAVEAAGLSIWAPWAADKRTEVIRNTNQYVETQQAKINGLVRQHDQLENYDQTSEIDRQQSNLVYQMCEAAGKIEDQYVPEPAMPLMRQEGCWS